MRNASGLTKFELSELAETMDNEPLEHLTNDDDNGKRRQGQADDGPPLTFSKKTTTMYIMFI